MARRALTEAELVEQAAPATPAAGFVRVYAKTDGLLYKKGPDGVEIPLVSGLGTGATATVVAKPTAEAVNSSTALQDDDALQFAIGASEQWLVRFVLYVDGATGGDFKAAVVGPAGATGRCSVFGPGTTATTFDAATVQNQAQGLGTGITVGTLGAGNVCVVYVEALVTNGATAGSIKLQWAQGTSSGTDTRVLDASYLTAWKVGNTVVAPGGYGHRTVQKAAAQAVTSSTTMVDDAELQFPIGPNEQWVGRFVLWVDGATAGDFKATVVGPAGATGSVSILGPATVATTNDNASVDNTLNALGVGLAAGTVGAGIYTVVYVDFNIVNGATPGLCKLQWAQNASSGTATHVTSGSYMTADMIGAPVAGLAPAAVYAEVYIVAAQSIAANTDTQVKFDTVLRQSSDNSFNTSTWKYTCPASGTYVVSAGVGFNPNISVTNGLITLVRNGAEVFRGPQFGSASMFGFEASWALRCTAGDILEIHVYKDTAGSSALSVNTANITFANFELVSAGRYLDAIASKTGTYTITATDDTVLADATSAAFTVTLPTAVGIAGRKYVVEKTDSTANAVTVATTSSQTINGKATILLTMPSDSWMFQSDGANWRIIDPNLGAHRAARTFSRQTWR